MVQRRQHPGLGVRTHHSARMRIERDRHHPAADPRGQVARRHRRSLGGPGGRRRRRRCTPPSDPSRRGQPSIPSKRRMVCTGSPCQRCPTWLTLPVKPTSTFSTSPRGSIRAKTLPSASKTPVSPLSPAAASGTPVSHAGGLVAVNNARREGLPDRIGEWKHHEVGLELFEGPRGRQREAAYSRAPQRRQMTADTQRQSRGRERATGCRCRSSRSRSRRRRPGQSAGGGSRERRRTPP